jgi:hypothetical protein
MARVTEVEFEFVDSAPVQLRLGTLYVSTKYRAIVHLCLCGCGEKVLLKLDPDAWSFTFDGRSISVHDSVGNIGLPCRSHYIVRRNRVEWLRPLSGMDPNLALAEQESPKVEPQRAAKSGWFARWFKRDR